ncbi:hypothetical protein MRX96_034931 [Rhipicephalus microplus]
MVAGGHPLRGVVPKRVLLRGNLKREQSFDSFYWDLRAQSPKHETAAATRRLPRQQTAVAVRLPRAPTADRWCGRRRSCLEWWPGSGTPRRRAWCSCRRRRPRCCRPWRPRNWLRRRSSPSRGRTAGVLLPRTNSVEEAPEPAARDPGPENTVTGSAICALM